MPMPTAMVTAVRPLARAMGRGVRRASAAGAASPPPPPDFGALADDVVRCLREGGVPSGVLADVTEQLRQVVARGGPHGNPDGAALKPYFADLPDPARSFVAGTIDLAACLLSRHSGAPIDPPGPVAWSPDPPARRPLGQTETPVPAAERPRPPPANPTTQTADVLIIGAAAAGLSAGACLQQEGLSCILLEADGAVGGVWERRYHRLHLHDIVDSCHLPYHPMPGTYPVYVSRLQFAAYLRAYQRLMGLDVRLNARVVAARPVPGGGGWEVQVQDTATRDSQTFRSRALVAANGMFTKPRVPAFPGLSNFRGSVMHSSAYATGAALAGKRALVVGLGNSGAEIACDLWEHGAATTILQRSPSPVAPRWLIGVTQQTLYRSPFREALAKDETLFWAVADVVTKFFQRWALGDVTAKGLLVSDAPPIKGWRDMFSAACMDIGTVRLIREGKVSVVNREIDHFTQRGVVLQGDPTELPFDAVIMATGYHMVGAHTDWLDPAVCERLGTGWEFIRDERVGHGAMAHIAGGPGPVPGLHFMWGNLQMIRDSAPLMARHVKEHLASP